MIVRTRSSWIESGAATDALATAERAAPAAGLSHFVTSLSASYSDTATGVLVLKQGAVELARWHVHNVLTVPLQSPLLIAPGLPVSLELEAGGTSIEGAVVLSGYTL